MIIYLDILIMLNFVINYCFLKLIYILFNEKVNKIRIILSRKYKYTFFFILLKKGHYMLLFLIAEKIPFLIRRHLSWNQED